MSCAKLPAEDLELADHKTGLINMRKKKQTCGFRCFPPVKFEARYYTLSHPNVGTVETVHHITFLHIYISARLSYRRSRFKSRW